MPSHELISPLEFEQRVPWSMSTVWRRLRAGDLPAIQSGGPGTSWLIDWTEFSLRLAQGQKTQESEASEQSKLPDQSKVSGPKPRWMKDL